MNDMRNLMVICQMCHDRLHAGHLQVGPLQMTSDGPVREIREMESAASKAPLAQIADLGTAKKSGKWSDEEIQKVRDTLRAYPSSSLKSIRAYLSSTHAIDMSESVISRIRKEPF